MVVVQPIVLMGVPEGVLVDVLVVVTMVVPVAVPVAALLVVMGPAQVVVAVVV